MEIDLRNRLIALQFGYYQADATTARITDEHGRRLTIDDDHLWNGTVRTMLMLLQVNDSDTQAFHREDVVAVLERGEDEDEWTAIDMGAVK